MKFIKKNSKYIGIVMICVFCSYLTTIATNYIFDSSDVRFDNTGTSLESVNVQDAIDETFHHVTDYNEIKTTIGNNALTTTNKTLTGGINEVNSKANQLVGTGKEWIANAELNNYTTTGIYYISTGATINGASAGLVWGTLLVVSGRTDIVDQTFIAASGKRYFRECRSNTWSNFYSLDDSITSLNSKIAYDWNSFTNYVSSLETGGNGIILRLGKMRTISFQGAARTHTEDEILATLPEADRPTAGAIFASGNVGSSSVVIRINTNGQVTLYSLNGVTASGRVYFNAAYAVG